MPELLDIGHSLPRYSYSCSGNMSRTNVENVISVKQHHTWFEHILIHGVDLFFITLLKGDVHDST
jgi:hypothetical protein